MSRKKLFFYWSKKYILKKLFEYSWLTTLCLFPLYSEVNQLRSLFFLDSFQKVYFFSLHTLNFV